MNCCRANDFGRRPGPLATRRVDNEDLQTQDHVASITGNHRVEVASFSSVADTWLYDFKPQLATTVSHLDGQGWQTRIEPLEGTAGTLARSGATS